MRVIKFRGESLKEPRWIYGDLLHAGTEPSDEEWQIMFWDDEEGWMQETVDPRTIGHFTGLYDQKRKEIYEGDIISYEFSDGSNALCIVGWNEEKVCFGIIERYAYNWKLKGYYSHSFDADKFIGYRKGTIKFEVVGNIHDNPELLEVKRL